MRSGGDPAVVLLQFDVHHAGDGVGAVDRGGTILLVFDALDRSQRDAVEIEVRAPGIVEGVRRGPVAVDQDEEAAAAEPARIDRGQTAVGFLHLQHRGAAGAVERQALREIPEGVEAAGIDLIRGINDDRLRSLRLQPFDARTGDLERLQLHHGAVGRFLWVLRRPHPGGEAEPAEATGAQQPPVPEGFPGEVSGHNLHLTGRRDPNKRRTGVGSY
jgi:hypothetical protein